MAELITQATNSPTRKITAVGTSAGLAGILVTVLGYFGVQLPAEAAVWISGLVTAAVGYFVRDRA